MTIPEFPTRGPLSMRRLVAMALLVLPLLAMRESRAEIAVVNNLAYPEIVWIYGKTSDPDPLPDFALVRPVDPAQAADPNGDANFDRQPDIVRQHGLPPSVVYSKWDAADHEIALMQWIAGAWTSPLVLTDNVEEDLNPRLAFDGSGRPVITWWRVGLTSTDVWVIRQRPDLTWTTESRISQPLDLARLPSVVLSADGSVRICYESNTAVAQNILIAIEDTSNFGQFLPELTIPTALPIGIDFGQAGAPMFEVRGAHTWLTWVDSETDLGYKEFLGSSWLATGFVPYSGLIDIQPARFRARNLILY